jgi:4-hydroxyphenylpyruvate dioxygenase-like putative hemolysin
MGTDGFAFVEFAHPEPPQLHSLFRLMGFAEVARHRRYAQCNGGKAVGWRREVGWNLL